MDVISDSLAEYIDGDAVNEGMIGDPTKFKPSKSPLGSHTLDCSDFTDPFY